MGKKSAFGTQFQIGEKQVETATVIGSISGSGNAIVIMTAAGMTGSPISTNVAVLNGDSADTVAGKIREELALDSDITDMFAIGGSGAEVVLTGLIAAPDDATLNINIDNGSCSGLTAAPASADTVAGVDYATVAYVTNIGGPGLALDTKDVTTHDQATAWEEVVGTILRSGEASLDIEYDPNETTHDATSGLVNAQEMKAMMAFQIIFPGSYTWSFDGLVTGFEPGAPVDGSLTAKVKVKFTGKPSLV